MTVTVPDDALLQSILHRGVSEVIVEAEFIRMLRSGRPLRLKQGFDPSAPDIHLGHVVGLRKLRQLQDLGHTVVLIVGDWTAQIGDPSERSRTRPMLTADEVAANAESYLQQFFKIVDRDKTEVRRQTEWFDGFDLGDVIRLTSKFTVAQILRRDDFAKRYAGEQPIAVTELLYPLLQAYDSVMVRADVEFGGTDQRFNNLLGRELQTMEGQAPQQVFLVPLLVGTDGVQKMSKSLGNYVAVNDPPNDMYGKVMSIADSLLLDYFEYLTDVPDSELEEMRRSMEDSSVNPMELKKRLAAEITAQFHGANDVLEAQRYFERTVQRREIPQDIPEVGFRAAREQVGIYRPGNDNQVTHIDVSGHPGEVATVDLIWAAGLAKSKGEAKRLISQAAVEIDQQRYDAPSVALKDGTVIKVGRRRYTRLVDLDKKP
ncbi:MAG: tyrosine--tRNA ligase [Chloroflexi bacterium]|nr:tyrosine--tRNA ligase [Chloroflexota bacterium]